MVLASAKVLGLDSDSGIVSEAVETVRVAFTEGYDPDLCASLGRSVLLRATQPEAFAAA
jgi:hypothetical protein